MTWTTLTAAKTLLRLWMRNLQPKRHRTPIRRTTRLFVERLEDRCTPTAVSWTGGANTLNWGDNNNWSNNAVPTSADDVTISAAVSGPINIGASAYSVRSLNDTSAQLSIASGGSLSLAAVTATSTLGKNMTVQSGGALSVGAGATVVFNPGVTLTDNGSVTFNSGDSVSLQSYYGAVTLSVGSGGVLTDTSSNFSSNGGTSEIYVAGGGHLISNNSVYGNNFSEIYLDNGSIVNSGDLVGNAFQTTLYTPAVSVQYLSNNLRFQDINVLAGTLTNGQSLSLNAIGTASTANLRYVFPGNFTVASGATLTVAPNVNVAFNPGVTLTDNGSVSFGSGDNVNFLSYYGADTLSVGSGGVLNVASSSFGSNGGTSEIYVAGGGEMISSNSVYGNNFSEIYFDNGSIVNPTDLVGNAFQTTLYTPAVNVQYLANNLRFQDINVLAGTLTNGQSLALNLIGTASTANLRYVFPGNFTVASGATLTVAPNVSVAFNPGVTLTDDGSVSFGSGDNANFLSYYGAVTLSVGSGGILNITSSSFGSNGGTSEIYVAGGGHFISSNSVYGNNFSEIYLDNGSIVNSGDLVGNAFQTTLYTPAVSVQYLANNLRFQDINILAGTLTNGQSLALNLIGTASTANLRYVFPGNFTVASGATMTVAPNVSVALNPGVTLTDDGSVSFGSGDSVNFLSYYGAVTLSVGSGGILNVASSSFGSNGGTSEIYVAGGGHLISSNSVYGNNFTEVYLDNGSILNSGDLVGNAFQTTLYTPAVNVQYLANNLRFQDINVLAGTLTNGQSLALNLIGTASTANLRYVFPGNFTVASGASMTVAPNVSVALNPGVTLTDNGSVSFGSGDTVNFLSYYGAVTLSVGSGGVLNVASTNFGSNGGTSEIYVAGGGHLIASNSVFGNGLTEVYLDNGSIVNAGDLVGDGFDTILYIPVASVQYLSNNLRFQDIDILAGTLNNGQTLALNAIGSASIAKLRYVFIGNFTIASGATVTTASNVNVALGPGVTLSDNGNLTFGSGDTVNFLSYYGAATLSVSSGGILSVYGTTFTNNGGTSQISLGSGGNLQANYSTINLSSLTLNGNSTDTMSHDIVYGVFTINSGATIAIANNDFSNLGNNGVVAVGDPNANIILENNYWGTTVNSQIAAKILDHNDDATRPTVVYSPDLSTLSTNQPPVLATIGNQTVNEGSTLTLTASATDPDGDTITYSLDPGAPAGASINATTGVFTYTSADGPASYTVTVRATDNGSPPLSAVQSFTITVNNVAPTATLSGPTDGFQGVRGQVRQFLVGATDPSAIDQAAGFTYDLHWGDGSPDTIVSGANGTLVSHIFTVAGTYTVTATATDKDGGVSSAASVSETINIAEVQNGTLMVGGTTGNDTFDLTPSTSNTNDITVSVNSTLIGTFSTSGQAQVLGDGGSGDVLNFDDQANTAADQYLITTTSVGRTNAATISFTGIGTLNVKAGTNANTIDVQSTAAGTPVNITMGNGADTINVGDTNNTLDSLLGSLSVTGGTGSTTLHLADQGSSANQTYTLATTTVNRTGAAGITYSKMKFLTVNGSSGADTYNVVNTSSTTTYTVVGGAGVNTLSGPNLTSTWTLTGANAGIVGKVTFSGITNLLGGTGTDTFKFNAAGSLSGTINGGSGSNKLDYSTYGGAVTINLQNGSATATGGMANIATVAGSTSSANLLIGDNSPNTWTITAVNGGKAGTFAFTNFSNLTGGSDVDVFKFSNAKFVSGVINGGGGGDWLDYSLYTSAINVNLATGSATGVNGGVLNIQNVRAGSGGSTMTGDSQGNILVGGAGADTIIGGSGRSVLIGGKGNDSVTGGGDDDIVIGGYTNFDTNNSALASILAEWQRTDETYSQRVSNLKTGGGLNGTSMLIFGTTVKDDGATNTLTGGAGNDWFFKGLHDTITDLQGGEQVN